jgi:hypothetical protein
MIPSIPEATSFIQQLFTENVQAQPVLQEAVQWLLPEIAATAPQLLSQFEQPATLRSETITALLKLWQHDNVRMNALEGWMKKMNPPGSSTSIITEITVETKNSANITSEATGAGDVKSEVSKSHFNAEGDVIINSSAGKQ